MTTLSEKPHLLRGGAGVSQQEFGQAMTRAVLWPVLAMMVLAAVFLGLIALLLDSARWVEHTDQVIAQTHQVEKLLVDRETGLRGYLLTGNETFLEPYVVAADALSNDLSKLTALVADNPSQLARLDLLNSRRQLWEAFSKEALARYEQNADYQSYMSAGIGKSHMDAMRAILLSVVATEEALRTERVVATERLTMLVTGGSLTLAGLLGTLLAWFTRRQLRSLARHYGAALAATERAAERLHALHQIDRAILARTSAADTVALALQRLAPLLDVPRAVALLRRPEGEVGMQIVVDPGQVQTRAHPGAGAELVAVVGAAPMSNVAVSRLDQLDDAPLITSPLGQAQLTEALVTPLRSGGELYGALALGLRPGVPLNADVIALVAEVADQLTIALHQEQLHSDIARHTAQLEQRIEERTAALVTANAELEAFGYSVAHDLRAPVRAMQSFAAALCEDYGEQLDALGQEYARRIVGAGERMEELIDDLLTYSRLSRAELSFGPVSLRQALDDALTQVSGTVAAGAASFEVVEPLPVVCGHRTTVAQMLANLLANALTFVVPGTVPRVVIRASEAAGRARLEVSDNGIGIAPEHQERIFRVFERLHSTEQYPGTGIGLAIVRKGAERMGGRAGVESRPGAGSTFWVELPMAEDVG